MIIAVGEIGDPDGAAVKHVTEQMKPGDVLALRIRRGGELHDVSVRRMSFEQFVELSVERAGELPTTVPATAPAATP